VIAESRRLAPPPRGGLDGDLGGDAAPLGQLGHPNLRLAEPTPFPLFFARKPVHGAERPDNFPCVREPGSGILLFGET